jgi:hypothetical protein
MTIEALEKERDAAIARAEQAEKRLVQVTEMANEAANLLNAKLAAAQAEAGRMREALDSARDSIIANATDTLWCSDRLNMTVVERINEALGYSDATPGGSGEAL